MPSFVIVFPAASVCPDSRIPAGSARPFGEKGSDWGGSGAGVAYLAVFTVDRQILTHSMFTQAMIG
jgi:hypothetical protein